MDLSKLPKFSGRVAEGARSAEAGPVAGQAVPAEPIPVPAAPEASSGAASVPAVPVQSMPVQPVPIQSGPPGTSGSPAAPPANPYDIGRIGFVETWMSVGIGVFVLMYNPRLLQWISSRLFQTNFPYNLPTDDQTGLPIPYVQLNDFKSDLGMTMFGVVLILDGLLFLTRRKAAVMLAIALTGASTLFNLWWVFKLYTQPGESVLPVFSCLAVLFGGMILGSQWIAFKSFPSGAKKSVTA